LRRRRIRAAAAARACFLSAHSLRCQKSFLDFLRILAQKQCFATDTNLMHLRTSSVVFTLIATLLTPAGTARAQTDVPSGTTLQVTNPNQLNGDVTVESGGTLSFSGGVTVGNNITISGIGVSDTGAMNANDTFPTIDYTTGTITLANDATIEGSSLRVEGEVDLGAHTLSVGPAGTGIVFLDGIITGTGGITEEAGGNLEMAGNAPNTYSGLTTISAGSSLFLVNNGVAISGDLTIGGSVEDANVGELAATTVLTLTGTGRLTLDNLVNETIAGVNGTSANTVIGADMNSNGSTLTLSGTGTYSYAGQITDAISGPLAVVTLVKSGAGTQVLTGANTFSGGTTIGDGNLQLGDGVTTGASLGSGAVTVNNTGTFTLELAQGETCSNAIHNYNSVYLNGAPGADYTVDSPIDGSGDLTKLGTNTVYLNHFDTYTNGTAIMEGTLVAGDSNALGSGDVTVASGAALGVAGGITLTNNITISGTGVGGTGAIARTDTLFDGVGAVTLAGDATIGSTSTTGYLSTGAVALGANTLSFTGGGAFVLGGQTTGTGGLDISNATVEIASPTANTYTGLTTVEQPSLLVLNNTNGIVEVSGNLSVAGTVNDYGSGQLATSTVLTLSGTGQYNFLINGTTETIAGLQGTSASTAIGPRSAGGDNVLTLGGSDFYEYAGQINDNPDGGAPSAIMSLVKTGTGTQVLTGSSTYSGGTTVSGGVLQLGNANTTGASLGTGAVTVNGTGTFTLDLAQGETFSNAIHDNNAVILDDSPSSDYTVASVIDGSGTVTKSGSNTVTLTNANSYSGGTNINDGALVVGNANALGTGAVQNNAMLTTNSTVTGLTVNVGGFTQGSTGVLRLSIFNVNDYDSVHLTNPASVAHLDGELLVIVPANVAPLSGHTFDLVTSSNPVQGQFSSVVTSLPSVGATVTYTNNAEITLQLTQLPFANLGPYTSNELAVAQNLDANAQNTTSGSLTQLITTLNGLSGASGGLGPYLDQLTPLKFGQFTSTTAENNASFATEAKDNYLAGRRIGPNGSFAAGNGSIDSSGLTLNDPSYDPTLAMVHSRMMAWNPGPVGAISDSAGLLLGGVDLRDSKDMKSMSAPVVSNPWNFFVAGNVVLAQGFSQNDISHFDSNTESVTLGADYRLTPHLLIGLAAGYGHTDATLDNNGSSATVDSYSPGFYASYADHGWYANLTGDYLHNAYTQSRAIGFLGQTANSAPEGNEGVANLDGGYDFHKGAWTFGPLAGVQYTHLTVDGYSESGSVADLTVQDQNADSLRSRLGGRVSFTYSHWGMNFTPHLDASWQHEFLDQARGITSQFTGAVGAFSVKTTNPSRDSALADLGLDADINRTVTVFGDYEVQAGQENYFGQSVQAGVKIGF
jgi:fibronectin-binding autotransporter adhesin